MSTYKQKQISGLGVYKDNIYLFFLKKKEGNLINNMVFINFLISQFLSVHHPYGSQIRVHTGIVPKQFRL